MNSKTVDREQLRRIAEAEERKGSFQAKVEAALQVCTRAVIHASLN